ncbi:hypothetical protein F2Q69_00017684 [Brassica cretica]|uniref:Uncharacterized protein n=1 Tax=Brassica cretica TaxID=69181 RepID=A0A8S9R5E2_BRACR|nr:hypothetical protein F2Q69_00017684 [Brassica cretica]
MDSPFPKPPREEILRPTYVIFDAEDLSIPDPLLLKKNIVTAIKEEGYGGLIEVKGYFADERMDSPFPKPPREEILRPTYVIFDAEDLSIPDPLLLKKNIVTAIKEEGYGGLIEVKGYFGDKQTISQKLLE